MGGRCAGIAVSGRRCRLLVGDIAQCCRHQQRLRQAPRTIPCPRPASAKFSIGTTRWCRTSKFDKPGKSPFMDMQLVPVYADEAGEGGDVRVNPNVVQNLGIRLGKVEKVALAHAACMRSALWRSMSGLLELVQSRVEGYVTRLAREGAPRARASRAAARRNSRAAVARGPAGVPLAARRALGSARNRSATAARQRLSCSVSPRRPSARWRRAHDSCERLPSSRRSTAS